MKLRRRLAQAIGEGSALARTFSRPRSGFRILVYHAVGTSAIGDEHSLFSVAPERFRQHVEVLRARPGVPVLPLEAGLDAAEALRIAVTFDDGYLDNLRIAAPLLVGERLPFTVFVTSSFVASRTRGFLAPEDLRELGALPGVSIGAHGATHRRLTECSDADLHTELVSSKGWLEDALGREVGAIAYPHGAVDARVRSAAARVGYRIGVCSRFGINDRSRDRMLLMRSVILGPDTPRVLRQKIRGDWDWMRWRSPDPAAA